MLFFRPARKSAIISGLAGPALGILIATSAQAQDAYVEVGKLEYEANCAACHGPGGKGDGPVAEVLTQKPSDLTRISENYSGTFPRDFLVEVIDGRNMINPHGDRQMPVWGYRFMDRAIEASNAAQRDVDARAIVIGRISALVAYIESIQTE